MRNINRVASWVLQKTESCQIMLKSDSKQTRLLATYELELLGEELRYLKKLAMEEEFRAKRSFRWVWKGHEIKDIERPELDNYFI